MSNILLMIEELVPQKKLNEYVIAEWKNNCIHVNWYGKSIIIDPQDLQYTEHESIDKILISHLDEVATMNVAEIMTRKSYLCYEQSQWKLHVQRDTKCLYSNWIDKPVNLTTDILFKPQTDDFTFNITGGLISIQGKDICATSILAQGIDSINNLLKDIYFIEKDTRILITHQHNSPITLGHYSFIDRMSAEMDCEHDIIDPYKIISPR